MNRLIRFVLIIYSTILAILSLLLLYALADDGIFADLLSPLANIVTDPYKKFIYLGVLLIIVGGGLGVLLVLPVIFSASSTSATTRNTLTTSALHGARTTYVLSPNGNFVQKKPSQLSRTHLL